MPTSTWRLMRREIMRPFGLVLVDSTTNLAGTTTVVSTELQEEFSQDDHFNGEWLLTVVVDADDSSGTPANGLGTTTRRITDYTASSGTLTTTGPNWSSEDEAVELDLYRWFHPDNIRRAFNRARQNVYPHIGIVREIILVTGQRQYTYTLPSNLRRIIAVYLGHEDSPNGLAENLFTDGAFDNWTNATTPTSWTAANGTATQEKATTSPANFMVLHQNSANFLNDADAVATLLETVTPSVAAESVEVNVAVWAYCLTASRLSASAAGTLGSTHAGLGWEVMTATANTAQGATTVAGGISVTSAAAQFESYIGRATMTLGPTEPLDREYDPLFVTWEHVPPVAGASNGGLLRLPANHGLPQQRKLRLVGLDYLSSVSADTDTVEIDGELLEPLYDLTRHYLFDERYQMTRDVMFRDMATHYRRLYEDAIEVGGIGLRLPPQRIKIPNMG